VKSAFSYGFSDGFSYRIIPGHREAREASEASEAAVPEAWSKTHQRVNGKQIMGIFD